MFLKNYIINSIIVVIILLFCAPAEAFDLQEWNLDHRVSLIQTYDDNVTYSSGNEKEDLVTDMSLGLDLNHEGKSHSLDIIANFKQQLFIKESSFNNISEDFALNFKKEISKYDRISIGDTFLHAEEPTSFEDDFGRTSGRYSYTRNRFNIQYEKDLSKRLGFSVRYGNEDYRTSQDDLSDAFSHQAGFDVLYYASSETIYIGGYEFLSQEVKPGGTAYVNTLSTGLRHFLTNQLYLDSRAGVIFVERFDGSQTNEPSFNIKLTNEFSSTGSASIAFTKTALPSTYSDDIFDRWQVALSFVAQLLERLSASASVFIAEGSFDAQDITDKQTGLNGRLNYDIRDNASVFLSYRYDQVDSNVETRGYQRNAVSWGATLRF